MSKDHVFVYGTLITGARDRKVRRLVEAHCRILGPAWVSERLYDLGPYPGMVSAGPPRLSGYTASWRDCSKPGYYYPCWTPTRASNRSGRRRPCWVYMLSEQPRRAVRLWRGDWLNRR